MDPLIGIRAAAATAGAGAHAPVATRAAAGTADGQTDDARARAVAARELGVTFLTQLMASMRRTVPDGGTTTRSASRDVLEDAFDRTVAEALSRGDPLGFERQLGVAPPAGRAGDRGTTQGLATSLKLPGIPADRSGKATLPSEASDGQGGQYEGR